MLLYYSFPHYDGDKLSLLPAPYLVPITGITLAATTAARQGRFLQESKKIISLFHIAENIYFAKSMSAQPLMAGQGRVQALLHDATQARR